MQREIIPCIRIKPSYSVNYAKVLTYQDDTIVNSRNDVSIANLAKNETTRFSGIPPRFVVMECEAAIDKGGVSCFMVLMRIIFSW